MTAPEPTSAQLERGLQVIRIAIPLAVLTIAAIAIVAVALLDAPAVPTLPVTAALIAFDLGFLWWWNRYQGRRIADARLREAGQADS